MDAEWRQGDSERFPPRSVDKSPNIDWMQERLDRYVQTDPSKSAETLQTAKEEAGGVL